MVKRRTSYSRRRPAKRRAPAKKTWKPKKAKKVDRAIANSKRFAKFLFKKSEEEEGKE